MRLSKIRAALPYIFSVLLFSAMIAWFCLATAGAEKSSEERNLEMVKNSVEKGITTCYAIEGVYPESIEYLKENYGVIYDSDKYIVHYESFAANIRPNVVVIEKGGAQQ